MDILLSSKLAPFFFLLSMDIHRNILMLASTLMALVNIGMFPGIFLGISMEMVLDGLREGVSGIFLKLSGVSISHKKEICQSIIIEGVKGAQGS